GYLRLHPSCEVRTRALDHALAAERLVAYVLVERSEQSEVRVHGLEPRGLGCPEVAPERAAHRRGRWYDRFPAVQDAIHSDAGEDTGRGGLRVAFNAGELPREDDIRTCRCGAVRVQSRGEVQVRVTMDRPGTQELRILETGDHAEDATLL